jgi:hypothetical protein
MLGTPVLLLPGRHGPSQSTVAPAVVVRPRLHGPFRTAQRYHGPYTSSPDRTRRAGSPPEPIRSGPCA